MKTILIYTKAAIVAIAALCITFMVAFGFVVVVVFGLLQILTWGLPYIKFLRVPDDYEIYFRYGPFALLFAVIFIMAIQIVRRDFMDKNGRIKIQK